MIEKRGMMRGIPIAIAVVMAGAFISFFGSSGAQAKGEYHYWNSSSNPLYVSGYGSWARAYGQWRVTDGSNGTRSYLDSRTWYYNADNHKKYADFTTQVNVTPSGVISAQFWNHASADTSHSNVTSQQWLYANTSVSSLGNKARALARVCLDVPYKSDPCSGSTITGTTNY